MQCPFCQHNLSYFEALRIINPFRHKCRSCGVPLTLGRQGVWFMAGAAALGAALASAGIFLEQSGRWTPQEGLLGFVMAFSLTAGIGEFFCWKRGKFDLVTKSRAPK